MPPKVKITKENIINIAVEIVRDEGCDALNARNIAARLNCSTQPIFSNFDTMEGLKKEVISSAEGLYAEYIEREIAGGEYPPYKASGMAYIRFAREEKNLFRLLYMRDRSETEMFGEDKLTDRMTDMVSENTGLSGYSARLFHLEIWAYVHGIAVIVNTGYFALDGELISQMITDFYQGLKMRFEEKEKIE